MPLTAMDSRASLLRSAPSAIWLATEVLTAPSVSSVVASTPSISILAWLA